MKITEKAFAKINIYLDVTARRPDGFHEIKTVMQSVGLCDTLEMECRGAENTELSFYVEGGDSVPTDENNLVCRAVLAYLSEARISAIVRMRLIKRIPVGAGLGGGSSDAAAALRGMNRVFGAFDQGSLLRIASRLGSDVAFCVIGSTALCEGRGERITPIPSTTRGHLVVAIGSDRISTPLAYRALDGRFSNFDGSVETGGKKHYEALLSALSRGELPDSLFNVFECVIMPAHPEISMIKDELLHHGATHALMSGSGAAVFGIFDDEQSARNAASALRDKELFAEYCEFV